MPRLALVLGNLQHFHPRHDISHAAVADGAGRVGHQGHDVDRAVLVDRAELVVAGLAHHRLAEIDIGPRAVLPADADDRIVAQPLGIDAQLRPAGDLSPFAVDLGQLFEGDRVQGVVLVDIDGQGVVADDELLGLLVALLADPLDFLVLHLPAGAGDLAVAVDEAGDADARAAAGNLDHGLGIGRMIVFRPALGQIDHRIGAFDAHPFRGRTTASNGR